jgi:DNA-binding NarL/FixJ family response regulator
LEAVGANPGRVSLRAPHRPHFCGGDADIRRALKAGVMAYLTKDVSHSELLKAIRTVHSGQSYPASVLRPLSRQQIAYSLNLPASARLALFL